MTDTPVFEPGDLVESGSWRVFVTPSDQSFWTPPVPYVPPTAPRQRPVPHPTAADPVSGQEYQSGATIDVTVFRGAPTEIGSVGDSDPFGPTVATLTFPAITLLDAFGAGDLVWLQPESNVSIQWVSPPDELGEVTVLRDWQGYFLSPSWGEDEQSASLTMSCVGAMRQMDNYLAKPEYQYQPLPYEVAILRQFGSHPDLRLSAPPHFTEAFPAWWTKTFDRGKYPPSQPWLLPQGVLHGEKWSGMLTRETGHFDKVLTEYIQGLLANMWTERGQFTLRLGPNRRPYLTHRERLSAPAADTLEVDLLWRGVVMNPTVDWGQKIGVIYGSGRAANGDTFSGMEVTADGSETYYDPLAYDPAVHPLTNNPLLNKAVMRKEVNLQYADGITALEARRAAAQHRKQFADPGVTGTLVLKIDPVLFGTDTIVPRATIEAGRSILVRGLFGKAEGVLFHITETSLAHDLTLTLTLDTQFRDYLTVDQVMRRTRDALVPYRMLSTAGTFDPKIPDLLYPWSYAKGAGVIPLNGAPIFTKLGPSAVQAAGIADPEAIPFPWEEYTTRFPPKKYPAYYVNLMPRNRNANYNWANTKRLRAGAKTPADMKDYDFKPYPVLFAAAGSIRLLQIAAYDRDGHVKQVPFHVSIYAQGQPSYASMPMIPAAPYVSVTRTATLSYTKGSVGIIISRLPRGHGITKGMRIKVACPKVAGVSGYRTVTTVRSTSVVFALDSPATGTGHAVAAIAKPGFQPYPAGQRYPFFPGAWEHIDPTGVAPSTPQTVTASGLTMLYGAGTYYEKAGYWPGSQGIGNITGLHSDETPFSFDFRNKNGGVDIYDTPAKNQQAPNRVTGWVMIYCDADVANTTYFLGRMFRSDYLQS